MTTPHWKPMAWLPNQDGFACIGLLHTGLEVLCRIQEEPTTGLHHIVDHPVTAFRGWRDLTPADRHLVDGAQVKA